VGVNLLRRESDVGVIVVKSPRRDEKPASASGGAPASARRPEPRRVDRAGGEGRSARIDSRQRI